MQSNIKQKGQKVDSWKTKFLPIKGYERDSLN